jgi:hypothetical protein
MLLNSDAVDVMKSRRSTFGWAYLCTLFTIMLAPINARAEKASDRLACAEVKMAEVDGTASVGNGHRLLELFPEISGLPRFASTISGWAFLSIRLPYLK